MSVISGTIGAILGSNAQKQSANTAAASQAATNAQNQNQYDISRGSQGSASLPLYLKGSNGGLFEPQLGSDLVKAYGDSSVPLSTFQAATDKTSGARNAALDFTGSIFNGGVTNRMLSNVAPVQTQRLATARSSSLDALHKTLDDIDAQQANRGYVGDSYGNRLLSFQAGKTAGDAIGGAKLENAQQTADIRNYGDVTLPMQNIQLPYQMNQQQASAAFLPQDEYLASVGQRMQPLSMLRLGYTGPFQYTPLPTPPASAFGGAASALSNVAATGSNALQYYMLQNALKGGASGGGAPGIGGGAGGGGVNPQNYFGSPAPYTPTPATGDTADLSSAATYDAVNPGGGALDFSTGADAGGGLFGGLA